MADSEYESESESEPESTAEDQPSQHPLLHPVRDVAVQLRELREDWSKMEQRILEVAEKEVDVEDPSPALLHLHQACRSMHATHSMMQPGPANTLPGAPKVPGVPKHDMWQLMLCLTFVAFIIIGASIYAGAFDGFDGNLAVKELVRPGQQMPFYLSASSLFTSAMINLLVFGPPDVSKLVLKPSGGQELATSAGACVLKHVTWLVKTSGQVLELGSFVIRVLFTYAVVIRYIKAEAIRSPTALSWMVRCAWAAMVVNAISPVCVIAAKQLGLALLMLNNMVFVRAHDEKWFHHEIRARGEFGGLRAVKVYKPFTHPPRGGFADNRPVGQWALVEVFLHPQGLFRANGPIVAVMGVGALAWGIVNMAMLFYALAGFYAYAWFTLPALRLWLLLLDNIVLPALIKLVGKDQASAKQIWAEAPCIYDTRLEPKATDAEKEALMSLCQDPAHGSHSRTLSLFLRFFRVDGVVNMTRWLPRYAWWCPGGRITPAALYDKEVDTLQRTGVTYTSWVLYLSAAIVAPCLAGITSTALTRCLANSCTFEAYAGALARTLTERHWSTFIYHIMASLEAKLALAGAVLF